MTEATKPSPPYSAASTILWGTAGEFEQIGERSPIWRPFIDSCLSAGEACYSLHPRHVLEQRPVYPQRSLAQSKQSRAAVWAHCTSTFDALAELEQWQGFRAWDWVLACLQERGRGQYGRSWQSPLGNLCVSLLLPPAAEDAGPQTQGRGLCPSVRPLLSLLPLLSGAALVRILRDCGWAVSLKWPNDIITTAPVARKVGGLLLEHKNKSLALGLGLNFAPQPGILPGVQRAQRAQEAQAGEQLPRLPPGSLRWPGRLPDNQGASKKDAMGSLPGFWERCSCQLRRNWQRWLGMEANALRAEVCEVLAFAGEEVEFFDWAPQAEPHIIRRSRGRLLGIGSTGELLLQTSAGIQSKQRGSLRPLQ